MKTQTNQIKRKPKANYKIFNTASNRYESSGSSSKTTWNSTHWVYEKLKDITKYRGLDITDFEIHIFPIESAIVKSAKEFIDEMKSIELIKKDAKIILENERKRNSLLQKQKSLKEEFLRISKELESL